MGNRIAKGSATEGYFDLPPQESDSLTYRPASDAIGNKKVCAGASSNINRSCAPDEVWWEETPLDTPMGSGSCCDRSGTDCIGAGEWGSVSYHTCSKVEASDCPILAGGVTPTRATATNPSIYDGRRIRCHYNMNEVGRSCEASTDFTQRAKEGNDALQPFDTWFNTDLMNQLCGKRADPNTCPKHPDGKMLSDDSGPICSEIVACPLCKDWALSSWPNAATESDQMMKDWCRSHIKDPSCRCINRENNALYKSLTSTPQLVLPKAGCWWKGCVDKQLTYNLVPSEDRSFVGCPTVYCANIINQSGNSELDAKTIIQSIDCDPSESDGTICIPSCGQHGNCFDSTCVCKRGWTGDTCNIKKGGESNKTKDLVAIAAASGAAIIGVILIASALRKRK